MTRTFTVLTKRPYGRTETMLRSVEVVGTAPLFYQWIHEGLPLPGQTSESLLITDLSSSSTGRYWVMVSNRVGSAASAVIEIEVEPEPEPLWFVREPDGLYSAALDEALDLCCVEVAGTPPVYYQWRRGGVPLPGLTGTNHVIMSLSETDFDVYDIVASNHYQVVTSRVFEVKNAAAPQFLSQPDANVFQAFGYTLEICCASVTGQEPLYFQWWKNDGEVAGATNLVFEKMPATFDDEGTYWLVVSNSIGSVTSEVSEVEIYSD